MSGINVQISMTNLTQMDRHQDDQHRLPVTQQTQNAEMTEKMSQKRISMPVEPDPTEKKGVNPDDGKRDQLQRRSRRKKKGSRERKSGKQKHLGGLSDHLIDVQV